MATLDALFYKEFTQTMQRLKGQVGAINLKEIKLL